MTDDLETPASSLQRRGRFLSFDICLTTLTVAAVSGVVVLVIGLKATAAALAIACAVLVAYAGSVWIAFRQKGAFLALLSRILMLMVLSGAASAAIGAQFLAPKARTPSNGDFTRSGPDDRVAESMQKLRELYRSAVANQNLCEQSVAACAAKIDWLKTATAEQIDNYRRQLDEDAATRWEERLRQEEEARKEREENNPPDPEPPGDDDPEPPTGGGPLAGDTILSPETREVLNRTPRGRGILEKMPLVGPLLGGMFGGRTKYSVRRTVQTIYEGGRIPNERDLYEIFAMAKDIAGVEAELDKLIDEAVERGVWDQASADAARHRIDEIMESVKTPLPADVQDAIAKILAVVNQGGTCQPSDTAPGFTQFASQGVKDRVIAQVEDTRIRKCLQMYPVTP